MFYYLITQYDLFQFEVRADSIGHALKLAAEKATHEIIRIEKILGI